MASESGQTLPLHVQKLLLDQTFTGVCRISQHQLTWEGRLKPSAVSLSYHIRLVYKLGHTPHVYLLEPDPYALANRVIPGRRIPHVYGGKPLSLCLYLPGSGEWNPNAPLATTILPWTCEWLSFFEDWVFSNVWSGGGVHPEVKEPDAKPLEVAPIESDGQPPEGGQKQPDKAEPVPAKD